MCFFFFSCMCTFSCKEQGAGVPSGRSHLALRHFICWRGHASQKHYKYVLRSTLCVLAFSFLFLCVCVFYAGNREKCTCPSSSILWRTYLMGKRQMKNVQQKGRFTQQRSIRYSKLVYFYMEKNERVLPVMHLVVVVSHIQRIGCQPEKNYFTRWPIPLVVC